MKQILLSLFLISTLSTLFAQSNQWTWLQGDSLMPQYGLYGIKGIPSATNKPGARFYAAEWKDQLGNFWLFGGGGYTGTPRDAGYLNDLWKYTPSINQWTWISGDNSAGRVSVFGTKGLAAPTNKPGARQDAISWTDTSGKLWLFGGFGNILNSTGYLNELWKYDPAKNMWTWMTGENYPSMPGSYGQKGIANSFSEPGARRSAVTWTDRSGNLWLFGGFGYGSYGAQGYLNDLWKYSPVTGMWTWVSGDDQTYRFGRYGIQGVSDTANKPGARQSAAGWIDTSGNLWLLGGQGVVAGVVGTMNDLWKYSPETGQWTWMKGDTLADPAGNYGSKGIPDQAAMPGARYAAQAWNDRSGNFWVQGGNGYSPNGSGVLNDLWKFNPATNEWIWMQGENAPYKEGTYGTMGVSDASSAPESRFGAARWTDDSGDLWLLGGNHNVNNILGSLTDLWRYSITSGKWTWIGGDNLHNQSGNFGVKGTGSSTGTPSAREKTVGWTDLQSNLWLFGGLGYGSFNSGSLNDLWKYTPAKNQWIWMGGDSALSQKGVYGEKAKADFNNKPGARYSAMGATDASGNLWMYGGTGYATAGAGYLNDLWKYTPSDNQWTWVAGDSVLNQKGLYVNLHFSNQNTRPAPRSAAVSWFDYRGHFYIFGGSGIGANGYGSLNDTWEFNVKTREWTWVNGDSTIEQRGTYGYKGIVGVYNTPGARSNAVSWKDANGNFWIFGGYGYSKNYQGFLNDLWMMEPLSAEWTWVGGENTADHTGSYGSRGLSDPISYPGGRDKAVGWTDGEGNLWLSGGFGYGASGTGELNDLWKYTPAKNQWTWMGGDSIPLQPGIYAAKGMATTGNMPGSRSSAAAWSDPKSNRLWMFGGNGYAAYGYGDMNDLWQYSLPGTALPILLSSFNAQKQQQTVSLTWNTTQEVNSRSFIVERSVDAMHFDSIGEVAAKGTSISVTSYHFIDHTPLNGENYYRLKQVDQDGKFTHSSVVKVTMDPNVSTFSILQNPVSQIAQVNLHLQADEKLTVQIRNTAGQLLRSQECPGKKGNSIFNLPADWLPPGTYLLSIAINGTVMTKKFIKR